MIVLLTYFVVFVVGALTGVVGSALVFKKNANKIGLINSVISSQADPIIKALNIKRILEG